MGSKKIVGTLNVTGEYQVNGSALATGTKLYRHTIVFASGNELVINTLRSTSYNNMGQLFADFTQGFIGTFYVDEYSCFCSVLGMTNSSICVYNPLEEQYITYDETMSSDTVTVL